jgi:hypothetical protein
VDNPLKKYVEALDNPTPYTQPNISIRVANYIIKALDYLHIYAGEKDQPELIESDIHQEAEEAMVDIVALAPEEIPNG